MARETFSSDDLRERLNRLAEDIQKKYNINVWFVKIFGKRLSYYAGEIEIKLLPAKHIRLNDRFGIVTSEWGKLGKKQMEDIISFAKSILESYEEK